MRHIKKAEEKGGVWSRDTTWTKFNLRVPAITFETTLRNEVTKFVTTKDTIPFVTKSGVKGKAKVTLKEGCPEDCIKEIYIKGDCPERDSTFRVPTAIANKLVADCVSKWDLVIRCIFVGFICLIVGALLGRFLWK
jgi:hypothetical protein